MEVDDVVVSLCVDMFFIQADLQTFFKPDPNFPSFY